MPADEPYHLLHTASMVGLFSCVFIKGSERNRIRDLNAAEVKRGMGGLHGNKVGPHAVDFRNCCAEHLQLGCAHIKIPC